MSEEAEHHEEAVGSSRSHRLVLKFLLGIAAVLLLATATLGWLLLSRPAPESALRSNLKALQGSVTFPVYYPSSLPDDFVLKPASAQKDSDTITFTLTYDGDKTAVVIQQARPPLMEEVTKTHQFTTSLGKAYIANLNGKKVGFLVTGKTLVILSSQFELAAEDIKALLRALNPV